jgi:hypothetical protein
MQAEGLDLAACIRVIKAGEKKADPTAAERQARYRARKASRVTSRRNPPNERDILTPEDTPTPSGVGPATPVTKSRGTRLPDDWQLPADWADWAKERRRWSAVEVAEESTLFANYWQARSGAGAVHRNWFKTWQNWVIRSHRKDGVAAPTPVNRTPAEAREWHANNAKFFRDHGREDDARRCDAHVAAIEAEHPELKTKVLSLVGEVTRELRVSRQRAA